MDAIAISNSSCVPMRRGRLRVDAILGEQTRPHSDLDLAVKLHDLPAFEDLLARQLCWE